ncbi:MAG TPA: Gfo/Idh/MocA family oxidoreductase, partial [Candidatus Acidoferrales bacterium]|nr:Gfo/Idh/MocA family oxidoreductase [Candidatus Acidoferrales bacterium]
VAIADISPVRRKLAQEALPHAAIYNDYRELLKANAANLDFVDISTPPCDHAAIAHAALANRFHVLCEKPLSCTIEEAHSLLTHARTAQRVLFPCHNYKHAPVIKTITEIIRGGRIGKVRSVSIRIYRSTHAKGVAEWNAHWRRQSRYSGGGIAMDHGSHSFYLTFDWLGSYPISIAAKMSNLKSGKYDTEDEFTAALVFPNGTAHVHLTWTAGVRKAIYVVEGEKGSITMEDDALLIETRNGSDLTDIEQRSITSDWADASHAAWFNPLFNDFRTAIDRSDYAGKEAQEALLCVQLINTAYRSAEQGSRELPLAYVLQD